MVSLELNRIHRVFRSANKPLNQQLKYLRISIAYTNFYDCAYLIDKFILRKWEE